MSKKHVLKIAKTMTDMVKMASSKVFLPSTRRLSQPKGMAASQAHTGWKQLWLIICLQAVLQGSPQLEGVSETWTMASSSILPYFTVGNSFTAWILIPATQVLFMSIALAGWCSQTPGVTSCPLSKPTAPAPFFASDRLLIRFKWSFYDSITKVTVYCGKWWTQV